MRAHYKCPGVKELVLTYSSATSDTCVETDRRHVHSCSSKLLRNLQEAAATTKWHLCKTEDRGSLSGPGTVRWAKPFLPHEGMKGEDAVFALTR